MSRAPQYPKRLIEVDLPIRRISAHARREKSIRHGHISTLHIWWARRPLAACRAVICAALWPDPADPLCPESFRKIAKREMRAWAKEHLALLSPESYTRFHSVARAPAKLDDNVELRKALLDFIADFANWDSSTIKEFLQTSRALTQAAHEGFGGEPGTRPLVVDPFAGGGSIPLEALRVGADAFASDINPIPIILNRVVLDYIPKYGHRLVEEVRAWGEKIGIDAEQELADYYPRSADGEAPIAYLWARTIECEGPGCGAEVPLIRSLWLSKKSNRSVALQIVPRPALKRVDFRIIARKAKGWIATSDDSGRIEESPSLDGTVKRGSATCPCCGYTTPVTRVREQLKIRNGGTNDARLMCVVSTRRDEQGRFYRLPTDTDVSAVRRAETELAIRRHSDAGQLSLIPEESLDVRGIRHTWGMIYGLTSWDRWFSSRQALALSVFARRVGTQVAAEGSGRDDLATAVSTCLALAIGRLSDSMSSAVTWATTGEFQRNTFARQALAFVWDFAEVNPCSASGGNFRGAIEWVARVCETAIDTVPVGSVQQASATRQTLPDDSAAAAITDPPYYDAVPYSYLSDYFYVWLRRSLFAIHPALFAPDAVPKDEEIVVDRRHELSDSTHDIAFYESELLKAFDETRRVVRPDGVGVIVFASKTTASWEAILRAVVDAGWVITGSWPIDTERESRVSAQGQARLASSIHIVCRPRENVDGSIRADDVGDWREVLRELPRRIHEWMPRLAEEGVVGADAIFSCLGPALEVFSRFSRVEKTSGEVVSLKEYLEHVWAAVSKEALSMIFRDPETAGLEPDARLTAMWLWTLAGPSGTDGAAAGEDAEDDAGEDDEEGGSKKKEKGLGFSLEFDAARKIAQGLGATLENLTSVVEVKGDKARLLFVGERARALFATSDAPVTVAVKKAAKKQQLKLFDEEIESAAEEQGWDASGAPTAGKTALDRVHQAMLLFGTGRSEALKRFLVEEGTGRQASFWKLAQALSALYPPGCDEKRWVDGVLVRKKGLGF